MAQLLVTAMNMLANPYSPPGDVEETDSSDEGKAKRGFRLAWILFAIPTFTNYAFWDAENVVSRYASDIVALYRGINVFLLFALFVLVGWAGLPLIRFLLGRVLPLLSVPNWQLTADKGLTKLPLFAALGSGVWMGWLVTFFVLRIRTGSVTFGFSLIGHLIAALWYVPILLGWFAEYRASRRGQ